MIQENIALFSCIIRGKKPVNIIIIIYIRLFHSVNIIKIKEFAIQALWRPFWNNERAIFVLFRRDNIKPWNKERRKTNGISLFEESVCRPIEHKAVITIHNASPVEACLSQEV